MVRFDYLDSLYCARCAIFYKSDEDLRVDRIGHLLCECGNKLRHGPRRVSSKKKFENVAIEATNAYEKVARVSYV